MYLTYLLVRYLVFIHTVAVNIRSVWVVCWPRDCFWFFHLVRISEMSPFGTTVSWWNHMYGLFCSIVLSSLNCLWAAVLAKSVCGPKHLYNVFCDILLHGFIWSWQHLAETLLSAVSKAERVKMFTIRSLSTNCQEKPTVSHVMCVSLY